MREFFRLLKQKDMKYKIIKQKRILRQIGGGFSGFWSDDESNKLNENE